MQKRPYPAGVHGKSRRRGRGPSDYGFQLQEKQKIRFIYQISDGQLRNYFRNASSLPDVVRRLEMRIDNIVFRLGLASSRRGARQLVTHGYFLVNGKKVATPSYEVRIGDTITIAPSKRAKGPFRDLALTLKKYEPPEWLSLDKTNFEGKIVSSPDAVDTAALPADFQAAGEFYSR